MPMYIVALVTASSKEEADKIAQGLLEDKLAACVNIIPGVESYFWWQDKIDRAKEALLVIKTKKELFNKLVGKVKSLHSYSVPEIISLPIISGNKDYLKWINDSTR
ncbi:MAG: divalent-cation tolerance protein CutA [Candidatus Omnitrophota bacterium]